jgi:hypothetical protein
MRALPTGSTAFGGVPPVVLCDYVPRHIVIVLCPRWRWRERGGDSGPGSRSSTVAKNRPRDDEHDHHGHHKQHQPRQRHAGTIACVMHHRSTDSPGSTRAPDQRPERISVQNRTPISLGFRSSYRPVSWGWAGGGGLWVACRRCLGIQARAKVSLSLPGGARLAGGFRSSVAARRQAGTAQLEGKAQTAARRGLKEVASRSNLTVELGRPLHR